MMHRLRLFLTLLVVTSGLAFAQSSPAPTRVVLLPFDANASVQAFTLGLPTALQRSLDEIPNLFAPAVGDAALVVQKATEAGVDPRATVAKLFQADVVIDGTVAADGGATLRLYRGSDTQTLNVPAQDGTPAALARAAARVLVQALLPDAGATVLDRVDAAAAQTPSLPSLAPVALAASRLPGVRAEDLATAAQLDPQSAWVTAEYARVLALDGSTDQAVTLAQQAAQAQPDDVEVQVVLGIVLTAAGQQDQAATAFDAALAVNPAHAVALTGRARVATDGDAARSDLEAAITAYPRMVDAYVQLAGMQSSDQRALQVLRRGESSLPESLVLRQAIVKRVLAGGDGAGALAYLKQAVQDPLARSPGLYAQARLLPDGQLDGALALVRDGLTRYPDAQVLQATEGELLVRSGDYAGAEAVLGPLHTQVPNDAAIANLLAVAQARQGEIDAARQTFESVAGTDATAQRALAKLYLSAGRASAALELLRPMVRDNAQDAELQAYYGIALSRVGRIDEAKKALQAALDIDPKQTLARQGLTLLQQQQDLVGGADIAFSEAGGAAFQQGLYALEVQDYAAAKAAFARAASTDDNGLTAFYLGYATQLTGDPRGALPGYQKALEAFPNSDIVLNNLGYAHLQLGRFDLALDQLQKALSANPDNARAHLNLGLTYYGLGRYQEALDAFDAAVKLDPSLEANLSQVRQSAQEKLGNATGP